MYGSMVACGQLRRDYKNGGVKAHRAQTFMNGQKNINSVSSVSSVHEVNGSCFRKDSVIRDQSVDYIITNLCNRTLFLFSESSGKSYILTYQQATPLIRYTNPPLVLNMTHDKNIFERWVSRRKSQQNNRNSIDRLPKGVSVDLVWSEDLGGIYKCDKGYYFKIVNNSGKAYMITYEFYSENLQKYVTNVAYVDKNNRIEVVTCGLYGKYRNFKIVLQ